MYLRLSLNNILIRHRLFGLLGAIFFFCAEKSIFHAELEAIALNNFKKYELSLFVLKTNKMFLDLLTWILRMLCGIECNMSFLSAIFTTIKLCICTYVCRKTTEHKTSRFPVTFTSVKKVIFSNYFCGDMHVKTANWN